MLTLWRCPLKKNPNVDETLNNKAPQRGFFLGYTNGFQSKGDIMAKSKVDKTNAMRALDQLKINYEALSYPCEGDEVKGGLEVAQLLGESPNVVYKTLVTHSDHDYVVAVIPSAEHLSLKRLAKVSGHKKLEMIAVAKLEPLTGYVRGGCSPIKMKKTFPTFIASAAETLPYIIISAGKRGTQIKIAPQDLLKAVRCQFADISDLEAE